MWALGHGSFVARRVVPKRFHVPIKDSFAHLLFELLIAWSFSLID
jgi:hypothetical protein